jgi:hypothetical protein
MKCSCGEEAKYVKKPLIGKKQYLCIYCVVASLNGCALIEPIDD